jgi:hypothetical protein
VPWVCGSHRRGVCAPEEKWRMWARRKVAYVRQGICHPHQTVCRSTLWWRDAPLLADWRGGGGGGAHAAAMCGLAVCMEKMVVVAAVAVVAAAKRKMIAMTLL